DAQREKLARQLTELEAAERVLARYSKDMQPAKAASARTPTAARKAAAPARGRGRRPTTTAKPAGGKRGSLNLNDRVLALATGKTQQEITTACKGARPNHVGAALPGISGLAASKSATGSSTLRMGRERSNAPPSDERRRPTPKGAWR